MREKITGKPVDLMANYETIIRNLVFSEFSEYLDSPSQIKISGNINPEYTAEYKIGQQYVDTWEEGGLWSFNGKEWRDIKDCIGGVIYSNGNHDQDHMTAKPLAQCVIGDELLFVEHVAGEAYGRRYDIVTVFSPFVKPTPIYD